MLRGRLLQFFVAVRRTGGGPRGFRVIGMHALRVENPLDDPADWRWITLLDARAPQPAVGWASSVVVQGSMLHRYGFIHRRDVGLARLPLEAALEGRFGDEQVWTGEGSGWIAERRLLEGPAPPAAVFCRGATEFSVRWSSDLNCWVQVQATGRRGRSLGVRFAPRLEGAWSDLQTLHQPPEGAGASTFLYAYKAHVEQQGAAMLITYASNSLHDSVFWDESIYWPRFIAIDVRGAVPRP